MAVSTNQSRIASHHATIHWIACVVLLLGKSAFPNDQNEQPASPDPIEALSERTAIIKDLARRRDETVQGLMNVVREIGEEGDLNDLRRKVRAIELLGEYRAAEASRLLVDEMLFTNPIPIIISPRPFSRYPAATALVRIGVPAMPELIARLNGPIADIELRICAFVVSAIYGEKPGLHHLQQILVETDPRSRQRKENLVQLISLYMSIDFSDPREWPSWMEKPVIAE